MDHEHNEDNYRSVGYTSQGQSGEYDDQMQHTGICANGQKLKLTLLPRTVTVHMEIYEMYWGNLYEKCLSHKMFMSVSSLSPCLNQCYTDKLVSNIK